MAFKFGKIAQAHLRKEIKNYNQRIRDIGSRHPSIKDALPKMETFAELSELAKTSLSDYTYIINRLHSFRGITAKKLYVNAQGARMTKWQYNQYQKDIERWNKQSKKQLFEMVKLGGQKAVVTDSDIERLLLMPKSGKAITYIRPKDLQQQIRNRMTDVTTTGRRKIKERYQVNYMLAVNKEMANYGNMEKLLDFIEFMDATEFYINYYLDRAYQISYIYRVVQTGVTDPVQVVIDRLKPSFKLSQSVKKEIFARLESTDFGLQLSTEIRKRHKVQDFVNDVIDGKVFTYSKDFDQMTLEDVKFWLVGK